MTFILLKYGAEQIVLKAVGMIGKHVTHFTPSTFDH